MNRTASLWGRAPLLGLEQIFAPRLDPEQPLRVFETPRQWLLGDRDGVCVVDPSKAPSLLRSAGPLAASSAAFGQRLRTLLAIAPTHILVPADADQKAA